MSNEPNTSELSPKGLNKKLLIGIACIIALAVIVVLAILLPKNANAKKVSKQLSLGEKYLSELDYEQAIAAYERAIQIDPKNEDAYIGLAEVYIQMGNLDKAEEVLKEAEKKVGATAAVLQKQKEVKEKKEDKENQDKQPEATPEPTKEPKATPEPTKVADSTPTPVPTKTPEKVEISLNTDGFRLLPKENTTQEVQAAGISDDFAVAEDEQVLLGSFGISRELTEEEKDSFRYSATMSNEAGEEIPVRVFADAEGKICLAFAKELPAGNYTNNIYLSVGEQNYNGMIVIHVEAAASPTPEPTAVPTPEATPSLAPTPSLQPTQGATPTPTMAPKPTATPTPTPTVTPRPTATPTPTPELLKETDAKYFRYVVENGEAHIIGYWEGLPEDVVVPKKIDGYPVTQIGSVLRGTYEYVPSESFYGCDTLKSIVIQEGVREILGNEFGSCENLTKVVLPKGMVKIGDGAFRECSSLTDIIIPESVEEIGDNVFYGCSSLNNIVLPKSLKEIGGWAFVDTPWLNQCTQESGYVIINHVLINVEKSLETFVIPSDVTIIASDAFSECDKIKNITIPESVSKIGSFAFSWCSSLQNVTISSNVTEIGIGAFAGCSKLTSVTIPNNVTQIENITFQYCSSLSEVILPNKLKKIGEYAFRDCNALKIVRIPEGVTEIGQNAFYGCRNLKDIMLPKTLSKVSSNAFCDTQWQKSQLSENGCVVVNGILLKADEYTEKFTIPKGVTIIGENAFAHNWNLKEITIPTGITKIDMDAFYACGNLQKVIIEEGIKEIGVRAFGSCENLSYVEIPESATVIGYAAFYGTPWEKAQESVVINHILVGVNIGWEQKSYVVPEGVTKIGDDVFAEHFELTSVIIPEGVTEIGGGAFCFTGLTDVVIPSTVTKIGEKAFSNSRLKNISIPKSVTEIEKEIFWGCSIESIITPKGSYAEKWAKENGYGDLIKH